MQYRVIQSPYFGTVEGDIVEGLGNGLYRRVRRGDQNVQNIAAMSGENDLAAVRAALEGRQRGPRLAFRGADLEPLNDESQEA